MARQPSRSKIIMIDKLRLVFISVYYVLVLVLDEDYPRRNVAIGGADQLVITVNQNECVEMEILLLPFRRVIY